MRAAHNDAIEAAAMVQVLRINEGGLRYMSGLSPEARAAIRFLKITTIPPQQPAPFKAISFGAKQLECATEGCTEDAIDHIIMGGVGSDYCLYCSDKVIAARNKDQPK